MALSSSQDKTPKKNANVCEFIYFSPLILFHMHGHSACLHACAWHGRSAHLHAWASHAYSAHRGAVPLEQELQMLVSCRVGAGIQTRVLWKDSHLSSPNIGVYGTQEKPSGEGRVLEGGLYLGASL